MYTHGIPPVWAEKCGSSITPFVLSRIRYCVVVKADSIRCHEPQASGDSNGAGVEPARGCPQGILRTIDGVTQVALGDPFRVETVGSRPQVTLRDPTVCHRVVTEPYTMGGYLLQIDASAATP